MFSKARGRAPDNMQLQGVYSVPGTQFVHGRSRMTIGPRFPTMPGRSTSGFHQPGRHCLHQARSAVRCSASRMNGGPRPSKNPSQDGLRHLVPTFLNSDDSANQFLCFLVWPLQRQQWVFLCTGSSVPYHAAAGVAAIFLRPFA